MSRVRLNRWWIIQDGHFSNLLPLTATDRLRGKCVVDTVAHWSAQQTFIWKLFPYWWFFSTVFVCSHSPFRFEEIVIPVPGCAGLAAPYAKLQQTNAQMCSHPGAQCAKMKIDLLEENLHHRLVGILMSDCLQKAHFFCLFKRKFIPQWNFRLPGASYKRRGLLIMFHF